MSFSCISGHFDELIARGREREPDSVKRKNLVDPASNICLDGGLSHANVRISRLRQICGRLSKKGKKKEGEKVCG